jgi:hypothetical protein
VRKAKAGLQVLAAAAALGLAAAAAARARAPAWPAGERDAVEFTSLTALDDGLDGEGGRSCEATATAYETVAEDG